MGLLQAGTSPSPGLLVTAGGSVGIGQITTSSSTNQGRFGIDANGNTYLGAYGNPGATALLFYAASGPTEIMRLSSLGNVGIGTAGPGAQLDLSTDSELID